MKLLELVDTPDGTYAGARFSDDSRALIRKYIEKNQIPNSPDDEKLHSTILYSRKYLPDYEAQGTYDPAMKATPTGTEIWPSQPDEEGNRKRCLVLKFDAPDLVARHESLMKKHDALYDFDEFKPHVTLSYDVGENFDEDNLPEFEEELEITHEYSEDLNTDWARGNIKTQQVQ